MKVVIYGKPNCPLCDRSKALCKEKAIETEYIDFIAAGMSKQDLEEIAGKPVHSVPQILVNGKHIGSYYELIPIVQKYVKEKKEKELAEG